MKPENIEITEDALHTLIKYYCRESGVRNLQKQIEKIFRKVAFKLVKENCTLVKVDNSNLQEFVGKPVFTSDRMYLETPPGVVMGLAWTSMGGSTLYIETTLTRPFEGEPTGDAGKNATPSMGSITVTGRLGDVMKESVQIAYTYSKSFLQRLDPTNQLLTKAHIHVHVPEVIEWDFLQVRKI